MLIMTTVYQSTWFEAIKGSWSNWWLIVIFVGYMTIFKVFQIYRKYINKELNSYQKEGHIGIPFIFLIVYLIYEYVIPEIWILLLQQELFQEFLKEVTSHSFIFSIFTVIGFVGFVFLVTWVFKDTIFEDGIFSTRSKK
jgi:hypothetical protein